MSRSLAVAVAAGAALSNSTAEAVLASHVIKANTFGRGSRIRVSGLVHSTAQNSTDTLTVRLRLTSSTLGGTVVFATAAVDQVVGDACVFDVDFTSRANPSPASEVSAVGYRSEPDANGSAVGAAFMLPTAFATDADLLIELTGQWSVASVGNSCQAEVFNIVELG